MTQADARRRASRANRQGSGSSSEAAAWTTGRPLLRIDVGTLASGSTARMTGSASAMTSLRRAVVDAQAGHRELVEPDAFETLPPRLGESVPGLRAVADDGEASRRAARQQHLPLGVGEFLRLVHHDVRERPGQQVRVCARQGGRHRPARPAGPAPRSIDITSISESSAAIRSSTTSAIRSRWAATAARAALAGGQRRGRRAGAAPRPGSGRSDTVQACASLALQGRDLVAAPATGRTCAGTPAPTTDPPTRSVGLEQRPRAVEGGAQFSVLASTICRSSSGGTSSSSSFVDQDRQQLVPDLLAGLVVRRAGLGRIERLGPVVRRSAETSTTRRRPSSPWSAAPRRTARPPRSLAPAAPDDFSRATSGSVSSTALGALGDEVAQRAGLHAVLAEAGQHVGDVGQVRLVRADEQHAAAPVAEPRVGVEQVGRRGAARRPSCRCPGRRRRRARRASRPG